MPTQSSATFCHFSATTIIGLLLCGSASAQQPSLASFKADSMEPAPALTLNAPQPQVREQHRFWDRNNCVLFGAVTALSAADFVVTRDNLQSGGRELNPITRVFGKSTAGLAVNFAGESAAVIGMSYFLHKTGHHKLERAVSVFNIANSATAVSFDMAHR
jgi:hypothetical protein